MVELVLLPESSIRQMKYDGDCRIENAMNLAELSKNKVPICFGEHEAALDQCLGIRHKISRVPLSVGRGCDRL
jgi:hypothetical protein